MTTAELKDKIYTRPSSSAGHYEVTIEYRGKDYTSTTTNMLAIDKIGEEKREYGRIYETEKQALLALWNEVKRHHGLK